MDYLVKVDRHDLIRKTQTVSYVKPKPEELLEEYLKAADNLTIYNTQRFNDMSRNQQALATEIQAKAQRIQSLEDDIKSMREDMKNIFEVLRIAKQNDGRIGKDAMILDENRHITFYEDYANGQTRSVSIPIDSVKIDVQDRQVKR